MKGKKKEMSKEITVNKLVEQTAKELAEAKEYAEQAYLIADKINESLNESQKPSKGDLESILVYTAKMFTIVDDWETYYNKFNKILTDKAETSNKQIVILEQEKAILEERLEATVKQVVTLEAEITRLREEQENKVEKVVNSLSDVLSLIDKNAKTIANFEGNRERQKKAVGKDSIRFIQELDTEKLIQVYKENNYSIPKEVKEYYNRKYGITYHGLRERLIKAGVWKGRR